MLFLLLACPATTIETKSADTGHDDSGDPVATLAAPAELSARLNADIASVIYVAWTQDAAATSTVEYSIGGEPWLATPPTAREAGAHEQIVLGVPFGSTLRYRVRLESGDLAVESETSSIDAGPLPTGVPRVRSVTGDAALWDADTPFVFLGMSGESEDFDGDWWTLILDREGRVVWAMETPYGHISLHPRVAPDGAAFLVDYNSYWGSWDGGETSQVARTRIDGVIENVWDTTGLHHPFTQLPDGTLAWGYMERGDETLEILQPDGERVTLWDCAAFLESLDVRPACGSNTLYYDESTDHFLFSFYSLDSVIEIDRQSGEPVRWFGDLPGAYTFDPPESQFWWQHGPNITADGTLLISTHLSERGEEATVVREFSIDEANEALHEVWSFGTEEEDWVYGSELGEAWRLPGGNTLHNLGSTPRIREATPGGEVAWDAVWDRDYTLGRSTPISDLYAFAP